MSQSSCRWAASVLFAVAGFGSLVVGLGALTSSRGALVLVVMGLIYEASAVVLLFIPSVRVFFSSGRETSSKQRNAAEGAEHDR